MNKVKFLQAVQSSKSLPELIMKLKTEDVDSVYYDRAMRMFLDSRARERAVPLKGVFELTPFCNLDCKMCYVHLNAVQMRGCSLLRAEKWEKVMAQAVEAGMMYATLTGGECLTHPDFERLYLFLHKHSVQISVLTNAVLLDEEKIEFFKKNPPLSVQATLYGANEDMYERVTGKREFNRVLNNLRRANEALLPLNLTVTPNRCLTKEENEEVIHLAASFGTMFRVNSGLITPRSQTERDKGFADFKVDDYIDFFKLEMELKGDLPPEECETDLPPVGSNTDGKAPKGLRCGGGRSVFNVTWEGKMIPCNRLTHINAEPLKEGFAASWQKIHEQVMNYILPVECESCAYRSAAKGCAAGHMDAKQGHASPEQCKWCRAMVRSGLARIENN